MDGLSFIVKLFAIQAATLLAWVGVGIFQRAGASIELRFIALCVVAFSLGAVLQIAWPVAARLSFSNRKASFYGVVLFVNVLVSGWVALACWLAPEPIQTWLITPVWGGIYMCPVILLGLFIAAAGDE